MDAKSAIVFGWPEDFFQPIDEACGQSESASTPMQSFKSNLDAAFQLANIPFIMARSSVLDSRYQSIISSENILQLTKVSSADQITDAHRQDAKRLADEKMEEELRNPEIQTKHAQSTLDLLDRHLRFEEFHSAAEELLRQVVVISWNSFEILANDLIRSFLNTNPDASIEFFRSKKLYGQLSERKILESLTAYNFDLSQKMGDVIVNSIRLDSLSKIEEALGIIWTYNKHTTQPPNIQNLYLLNQQRNLIVHKRGIVDESYAKSTPDDLEIGSTISFTRKDVEAALKSSRDCGCSILRPFEREN